MNVKRRPAAERPPEIERARRHKAGQTMGPFSLRAGGFPPGPPVDWALWAGRLLLGGVAVSGLVSFALVATSQRRFDRWKRVLDQTSLRAGSGDRNPLQGAGLDALKQRSLFYVPPPPPPKLKLAAPTAPPPAPKIPLAQKASYLKLVGIVPDNPPQAIVEDSRRQTSLYVTAGQMIDQFHVDQVTDQSLIISSDGETLELKL